MNVKATAWPHTAIVEFTPPTDTDGRTITGYEVSGETSTWITGSGTKSPIMAQGIGNTWAPTASQAFKVVAKYSDGSTSTTSGASNAVVQTGGAGPSTSPNVYVNGMFYWEGDFDFSGTSTYTDTTGDPEGDAAGPGAMDVMFTSAGSGGGWQPYAPTGYYDTTPYTYLQFDLKPTTANKQWTVYFMKYGDTTVGAQAQIPSDSKGTYGPAPVVGEWTTYKIPLKNMNVGPETANTLILKFCIGDGQPTAVNHWYVNNVKFVTE
jgi:hypothetical protein